MNGRKHDFYSALKLLASKNCHIDPLATIKTVIIPRNVYIGIKSWGIIDYLFSEHGYGYRWD